MSFIDESIDINNSKKKQLDKLLGRQATNVKLKTDDKPVRASTPTKNDIRRHEGKLFNPHKRVKPEYTVNPVSKLPPNSQCPCHSGKKFKKCCGPDTPPYILRENLAEYEATYSKALAGEQAW